MHSPSALRTSLLPLVLHLAALAAPLQDAPEFALASLNATFPTDGPYGTGSINSFLSIAVTYPDAASAPSSSTTTCRLDWHAGVDPGPTAWTPCADPVVQMRLPADGWTSIVKFRVELWETLTPEGAGLDAAHTLVSMSSDPKAEMFCLQMGKFNPLTCTLTGPMGQAPRTVVMPAVEESARPE